MQAACGGCGGWRDRRATPYTRTARDALRATNRRPRPLLVFCTGEEAQSVAPEDGLADVAAWSDPHTRVDAIAPQMLLESPILPRGLLMLPLTEFADLDAAEVERVAVDNAPLPPDPPQLLLLMLRCVVAEVADEPRRARTVKAFQVYAVTKEARKGASRKGGHAVEHDAPPEFDYLHSLDTACEFITSHPKDAVPMSLASVGAGL